MKNINAEHPMGGRANPAQPLPSGLKTETLVTNTDPFDYAAFGVVGIDVAGVLELLWPDRRLYETLSYEDTRVAIVTWCEAHGAHYYARCREEFDTCEAARETVAAGLRRVVLEDLS
jgi:hypothetical protein